MLPLELRRALRGARVCLPLCAASLHLWCGISPGNCQKLLVDRGIPRTVDAPEKAIPLARPKESPGFFGDHFTVGARGEVWIIDTIRVWGVPDSAAAGAISAEKAVLFGGIENDAQTSTAECDCHNLMAIGNGSFAAGAGDSTGAVDSDSAAASPLTAHIRPLDFRNLRWSVPGGVPVEFGVMATAHTETGSAFPLRLYAGPDGAPHRLKAFDAKGKFEGAFQPEGGPPDQTAGIYLQVWGHLTASVSLRRNGAMLEAVLHGNASFDASRADTVTLRLGPKAAAPTATRLENSGSGQPDLVASFRAADAGIGPDDLTACLSGALDGVPFEGCDLTKKPK